MAVDTRNKRFSLVNLATGIGRVLPNPGSGSSAAVRQQLEYLYALAGVTPTGFNPAWAIHANTIITQTIDQ